MRDDQRKPHETTAVSLLGAHHIIVHDRAHDDWEVGEMWRKFVEAFARNAIVSGSPEATQQSVAKVLSELGFDVSFLNAPSA